MTSRPTKSFSRISDRKKNDMATEIINARIESTMLGIEDHGILTCFLTLEWDDTSVQGFGGYDLRGPKSAARWITGILEALDIDRWEDLPGKYVRMERESSHNGKILRIGHLTKNKWFNAVE